MRWFFRQRYKSMYMGTKLCTSNRREKQQPFVPGNEHEQTKANVILANLADLLRSASRETRFDENYGKSLVLLSKYRFYFATPALEGFACINVTRPEPGRKSDGRSRRDTVELSRTSRGQEKRGVHDVGRVQIKWISHEHVLKHSLFVTEANSLCSPPGAGKKRRRWW